MTERPEKLRRRVEEDRVVMRYTIARESGDYESMISIMDEVARHPELERIVLDLDDDYTRLTEEREVAELAVRAFNQKIAADPLALAVEQVTPDPPAPTLLDAVTRAKEMAARNAHSDSRITAVADEAAKLQAALDADSPLPERPTRKSIRELLATFTASVSDRLVDAIFQSSQALRMSHQQGLAAARKQRARRAETLARTMRLAAPSAAAPAHGEPLAERSQQAADAGSNIQRDDEKEGPNARDTHE